ncbi:MAG: acyl-CoA dehydrogenase family protein [Pseudomonadota bacterium]
MEFDDPPEHEMLRRSVRQFFERELPERRIREMDRARKIPRELWKRFGELGWAGLSVPVEHGGAGADVVTGAVLCEELARRFPSLATDWLLLSMTARILREAGSAEQQAALLPRLARGEFIMAFGMTEPGGGTDVLALQTRATFEGNQWVVRGQKLFTSFADEADAILVAVPDRRGGRRQARPRPVAGADAAPAGRRDGAAARADGHACRLHLRGLPGRRARPRRRRRHARPRLVSLLATLDEERILCAALYVGITAAAALDQALQYARDRQAFGRPIGAFQAVQHPLAEVATELEQIRLLTAKAAWLQANGRPCASEAAMAKLAATETAIRATDKCLRVLGGYGLVEESPLERLFRDTRLGPFSPISNEMAKNVIGERLGLPRSY